MKDSMNTEISFATAPQSVQKDEQTKITSDPFFPVVNLNDLRAATRIDATITSERLFQAAVEAVIHVNQQLEYFKKNCMMTGKKTLAEHGAKQQINGLSIWEHRYLQAVYNYTQATLNEQYADYDATGKTASRSEAKQQNADNYRRDGHAAIADILGNNRIDAALI